MPASADMTKLGDITGCANFPGLRYRWPDSCIVPSTTHVQGHTLADSKLTHERSLALLHKLATDDGFRSRYEQNPAAALAELGVPQELIDGLPASSKAPLKLAPRPTFADALEHFRRGVAEVYLCQSVPQVSLSISAQSTGKDPVKIPFADS
jgi:putative modified peptide